MVGVARLHLLHEVADRIPTPTFPGCARVAVDGVDGVGKSTFAGQLATILRDRGRPVVQVSADGFLHRRAVRYARGRDSYDYDALRRDVLGPFGPDGSRRYRPAAHDLRTDEALDLPWRTAAPGTVLVVDGLFLHRDELWECWDFSVFLDAPVEITVARLARRDGSHPDPSHPSQARYIGGQRLYAEACDPRRRARLVVDNTDVERPVIVEEPAARREPAS